MAISDAGGMDENKPLAKARKTGIMGTYYG